jgi:hypothetical protein
MAIEKREVIEGIKTFFVVPDLSVMPEDFLPNFFLKGFEAYYLMDDQYLDIPSKVRILLSLFPELILFFNTDRKLANVDWPSFVRAIKDEFDDKARMGVLYGKHIGEETRHGIEKTYLYDIGITCGCIPIEFRKAGNLSLLLGVLTANQANGRRKYLRAICGETSEFNYIRDGERLEGRVLDISISHFSCAFSGPDPELSMYERATAIQLRLGGIICTVDAVLFTKRVYGESSVYVFVFKVYRGKEGLAPEMLAKINGFIHDRFDRGVSALVQEAFEAEMAKRREAKAKSRKAQGGT